MFRPSGGDEIGRLKTLNDGLATRMTEPIRPIVVHPVFQTPEWETKTVTFLIVFKQAVL